MISGLARSSGTCYEVTVAFPQTFSLKFQTYHMVFHLEVKLLDNDRDNRAPWIADAASWSHEHRPWVYGTRF